MIWLFCRLLNRCSSRKPFRVKNGSKIECMSSSLFEEACYFKIRALCMRRICTFSFAMQWNSGTWCHLSCTFFFLCQIQSMISWLMRHQKHFCECVFKIALWLLTFERKWKTFKWAKIVFEVFQSLSKSNKLLFDDIDFGILWKATSFQYPLTLFRVKCNFFCRQWNPKLQRMKNFCQLLYL